MRRTVMGVVVALLAFSMILMGCSGPMDSMEVPGDDGSTAYYGQDAQDNPYVPNIPEDAKAGGSGAGYAGWALDEILFPAWSGDTVGVIEHNGVVRTGGSAWQMALKFQADPEAEVIGNIGDYIDGLWDGSSNGLRKLVIGGDNPIYPTKPVYPMKLIYPEKDIYPMKDIYGYTDTPWDPENDDRVAKYGDAPTAYGGWAKSDSFPVPQNKDDPRINNGNFIEFKGVYRGGQNWTDMAIEFSGDEVTVDLISGQDKVVGGVKLELVEGQVKVSLFGDNEEDVGIINHVALYESWWFATSPMIGEGNWDGNEFHNQPAAFMDYPGGTVYVYVKGKVAPFLGMWGKIGEEPDTSKPPIGTEPDYDAEPIVGTEPDYNADPIGEEPDTSKPPIGYEDPVYAYVQAANIIEGQDHLIGKFVAVDAGDGNIYLGWIFYFPKSKDSHIQYIADKDLGVIANAGLGTWIKNENIPLTKYGFYLDSFVPVDYITGDLLYIAAHPSN